MNLFELLVLGVVSGVGYLCAKVGSHWGGAVGGLAGFVGGFLLAAQGVCLLQRLLRLDQPLYVGMQAGRAGVGEAARLRTEVSGLGMEEARVLAFSILENSDRYRVEQALPNESEREVLGRFAPGLREFFSRYGRVEPVNSDTCYSRVGIGKSAYAEGCLRIGRSGHGELVVRPGEGAIYRIDGPDETLGESEMPSIFHWIVLEDRVTGGRSF